MRYHFSNALYCEDIDELVIMNSFGRMRILTRRRKRNVVTIVHVEITAIIAFEHSLLQQSLDDVRLYMVWILHSSSAHDAILSNDVVCVLLSWAKRVNLDDLVIVFLVSITVFNTICGSNWIFFSNLILFVKNRRSFVDFPIFIWFFFLQFNFAPRYDNKALLLYYSFPPFPYLVPHQSSE